MAEGTKTPEVGIPIDGDASTPGMDVATVTPSESLAAAQTENRGLFGFLGKLLGRNKGAGTEQIELQETPDQIKDRMAALQADKKNVEAGMRSSDSTGSSRIQDQDSLASIENQLKKLNSQLPDQPGTTPNVSPTPIGTATQAQPLSPEPESAAVSSVPNTQEASSSAPSADGSASEPVMPQNKPSQDKAA